MKSTRTQRPPAIPVAPKKKGSKFGSLVAITIAAGAIYAGFTHKDEIVGDFSPPPKQPEVIVVEDKPTPEPFDKAAFFAERERLAAADRERLAAEEAEPKPVKPKPTPVVVAKPEPKKPELTQDQRFANALKEYKDIVDKKVEEVGLSVWCPKVSEFQSLSQAQQDVLKFMKYVSDTEEAYELRTSLEKKHSLEQKIYPTIQYQLWGDVKTRCKAIVKNSRMGVLLEYHHVELEKDWNASKKPILENWPFIKDVSFMWERALFTGNPHIVSGRNGENIIERRTLYVPYVVMKDSELGAKKGQYAVAEFEILLGEEGITFDNMSPGRGQLYRGRGVMTHVDVIGYIVESHQ